MIKYRTKQNEVSSRILFYHEPGELNDQRNVVYFDDGTGRKLVSCPYITLKGEYHAECYSIAMSENQVLIEAESHIDFSFTKIEAIQPALDFKVELYNTPSHVFKTIDFSTGRSETASSVLLSHYTETHNIGVEEFNHMIAGNYIYLENLEKMMIKFLNSAGTANMELGINQIVIPVVGEANQIKKSNLYLANIDIYDI